MRYVIIRDDDTNALTPVECLERLYRPLLERGLPVNLATIPAVGTGTKMADGRPEGYLLGLSGKTFAQEIFPLEVESRDSYSTRNEEKNRNECSLGPGHSASAVTVAEKEVEKLPATIPIASNQKLTRYLRENDGFHIVHHGCHHDYLEFERVRAEDVAGLIRKGTEHLLEAGFSSPETFVAPYDKFSPSSLLEVAHHFPIISTGWFEFSRLPRAWWPQYAYKKLRAAPHWRVGNTLLLSHPGCLLSYTRSYSTMLDLIVEYVNRQQVTVLVTHWWEYFREDRPDEPFIEFLHQTARYLAEHPDIKVISFSELAKGDLPLN